MKFPKAYVSSWQAATFTFNKIMDEDFSKYYYATNLHHNYFKN
jgi:hypothetical protein